MNFAAVVVTYNRQTLLEECLSALSTQSCSVTGVTVVDNASTDGTVEWLADWLPEHLPKSQLLALEHNSGGAGGFATGLKAAVEAGADWIWMMDDDACPHPDALQELMKVAKDPRNIYGSLAVNSEHTSWTTTLLDPGKVTNLAREVPDQARVESIPLLGFLIHRDLVERIGYPDAGFFIAADDVEYCLRARRAGANIIIAGRSHIEHPRTVQQVVLGLGAEVTYLSLPPWKRYYDTRNRLLIARKYHGRRLYTQAIPGSVLRLLMALHKEPRKLTQLKAWCCAMWDGLRGVKGKRHERWSLGQ